MSPYSRILLGRNPLKSGQMILINLPDSLLPSLIIMLQSLKVRSDDSNPKLVDVEQYKKEESQSLKVRSDDSNEIKMSGFRIGLKLSQSLKVRSDDSNPEF